MAQKIPHEGQSSHSPSKTRSFRVPPKKDSGHCMTSALLDVLDVSAMNVSRQLSGTLTHDNHDYGDALRKSFLFLRAQRSGILGEDNPIPWRSSSSFLNDGADVGVDLSGGYFDAGDYVKYGQPAAYTLSVLAWGALEFTSGFRKAGALSEVKAAVRWGSDYILKAASHLDNFCTYHAQVLSPPSSDLYM